MKTEIELLKEEIAGLKNIITKLKNSNTFDNFVKPDNEFSFHQHWRNEENNNDFDDGCIKHFQD